MRPLSAFVLPLMILSACDDSSVGSAGAPPVGPPSLGLFGDGYPQPGDLCYRAGETEVTVNYLDDSADLVACPPGTDPEAYSDTSGGTPVAVVEGWTLFSVPR